jgi:hypothetical protein
MKSLKPAITFTRVKIPAPPDASGGLADRIDRTPADGRLI